MQRRPRTGGCRAAEAGAVATVGAEVQVSKPQGCAPRLDRALPSSLGLSMGPIPASAAEPLTPQAAPDSTPRLNGRLFVNFATQG